MSLSHLQMRLCAVRQLRQNGLLLAGTVLPAFQLVLHCAAKASQRPSQPLDFRGEVLTVVFRFLNKRREPLIQKPGRLRRAFNEYCQLFGIFRLRL